MILNSLKVFGTISFIVMSFSTNEVKGGNNGIDLMNTTSPADNSTVHNVNETDIDLRSSKHIKVIVSENNDEKSHSHKHKRRKPKHKSKTKKKKYYIVHEKKDWNAAMAHCESKGHKLATPRTNEENQELIKLINPLGEDIEGIWIGGYCYGPRPCEWRNPVETIHDYSNFHEGEPNHGRNGQENCMEFWRSESKRWAWNDSVCSILEPFICEEVDAALHPT